MKSKEIIFSLLFCLFCWNVAFAQEHVSHYFDLESEFVLPQSSCAYAPGTLIGCVAGDKLYFAHSEAAKERKAGFVLPVEILDLKSQDWRRVEVHIPPVKKNRFLLNGLWISSLQVAGDRLIVATNFNFLVYELSPKAELKLLDSWDFPNPDYGFIVGKKYYAVSKINDFGFELLKQSGGRLDSVASFPMDASFLLQYGPNGFLKQCGEKLFFLNPPSKKLQVFDLSGKILQEMELDIPDWNPLPDSYVQEIMALPYSGDRALHVFYTSKAYSFPLEVFPLDEKNVLVAYHQGRPDGGMKIPFLLLCMDSTENGTQVLLTADFAENHEIEETEFPFFFAGRVLRLRVDGEDRIVQLVKTAPVDYVGKTWSAYLQDENAALATQRPDVKVRVMRYRQNYPEVPMDSLPLIDFSGQPFPWSTIPTPRALFILNRPPQCHACEEQISAFANTLGLKECSLYVVDSHADDFMRRRECMDVAKQRIKVPFTSLFLTGKDGSRLSQILKTPSFPLILLWERGSSQLRVVGGLNLFPDNLMDTNMRREASEYLRGFAH